MLQSQPFYPQKFNYIHLNPVKKDYVERPEHWKWSSANPDSSVPVEMFA